MAPDNRRALRHSTPRVRQSVIAAVNWLAQNRGKSFYLIGSDYIWPRTTNKIARPAIAKVGGTVTGEEYYPLGHTQFTTAINKIRLRKPDVILSTIVGGSNVAFYKQLLAAGVTSMRSGWACTCVSGCTRIS